MGYMLYVYRCVHFLINFILCGGIIIKEEIIHHFLEGVLIFNTRSIVITLESERQRYAVLVFKNRVEDEIGLTRCVCRNEEI